MPRCRLWRIDRAPQSTRVHLGLPGESCRRTGPILFVVPLGLLSVVHPAEHLGVAKLQTPIVADVHRDDVIDVGADGGVFAFQAGLAEVVVEFPSALGDTVPGGVVTQFSGRRAMEGRCSAPYPWFDLAASFDALWHGSFHLSTKKAMQA